MQDIAFILIYMLDKKVLRSLKFIEDGRQINNDQKPTAKDIDFIYLC